MTKNERIDIIHENFINGNRKDAVRMIDEHCIMYDFWEDYKNFLAESYTYEDYRYKSFSDMVISYHRIKNR